MKCMIDGCDNEDIKGTLLVEVGNDLVPVGTICARHRALLREYEIRVLTSDGKRKTATWIGTSGDAAMHSYAELHPSEMAVAWRLPPDEDEDDG